MIRVRNQPFTIFSAEAKKYPRPFGRGSDRLFCSFYKAAGNAHQSLRSLKKNSPSYLEKLESYSEKYTLAG